MRLFPIKTDVIKPGDNIAAIILESIERQGLRLEGGDIIAIASKVIAYTEGCIVKLSEIKPSKEAERIAGKFAILPQLAELVIQEAGEIYGGVESAILTLKNEILTPNAGIDSKNAPEGTVVLWPKNFVRWAKTIREEIIRRTGIKVAVLIVDSGLKPLRLGTTGLALAVAGFKPVRDCRNESDIFGKKVTITLHALADDLASGAHFLMGETSERIPAVLIREANVDFDDEVYGPKSMALPSKRCIFMKNFKSLRRNKI